MGIGATSAVGFAGLMAYHTEAVPECKAILSLKKSAEHKTKTCYPRQMQRLSLSGWSWGSRKERCGI